MFYEYLWYSDFLAVFLRSLKHAFDCLSGKRHGHFSSSHVPNVANIPRPDHPAAAGKVK